MPVWGTGGRWFESSHPDFFISFERLLVGSLFCAYFFGMLSGSLRDAMASMLEGNPSFSKKAVLGGILRFWGSPFQRTDRDPF